MSGEYPEVDHLKLLHDQLSERSAHQDDELEGLDRKASTMLASVGLVFGLILNNADHFSLADLCTCQTFWFPVAYYVALFVLAVGLLFGVWQLWPQNISVVPRPGRLIDGYYWKPTDETLAVLLSARVKALEQNEGLTRKKSLRLRVQMVSVGGGGLLLLAAYLLRQLEF
jgi:hypothetical protein